MHNNFAKSKVIAKCKNDIDKPWKMKNEMGKVQALLLLRRPSPAPYFHSLFQNFQIPPPLWGR